MYAYRCLLDVFFLNLTVLAGGGSCQVWSWTMIYIIQPPFTRSQWYNDRPHELRAAGCGRRYSAPPQRKKRRSGTAAAPPCERHGSTPAALQDTAITKRPPATPGDGHKPTLYPLMRGNRILPSRRSPEQRPGRDNDGAETATHPTRTRELQTGLGVKVVGWSWSDSCTIATLFTTKWRGLFPRLFVISSAAGWRCASPQHYLIWRPKARKVEL